MVTKKRESDSLKIDLDSKRAKSGNESITDDYSGFKITQAGIELPVVDLNDITKETFQREYIMRRKPCLISGIIPGLQAERFGIEQLESTLEFENNLQVEKKINGGFGSGVNREKMSLSSFIERILNGDDSLYLTTQYTEDDAEKHGNVDPPSDYDEDEDEEDKMESIPKFASIENASQSSLDFNDLRDDYDDLESDEDFEEEDFEDDLNENYVDVKLQLTSEEANQRIAELFQGPLKNMYKKSDILPVQPEILDILVPQQINIWVGSSPKRSVDIEKGIDESQSDLGIGRSVPGNGTSSGLHHDHADNIYVPIMGHKRFTLFSPNNVTKLYTVGKVDKLYNSGVINYTRTPEFPSWANIREDGAMISEVAKQRLELSDIAGGANLGEDERKELLKIIADEEEALNKIEVAHIGEIKKDPPSFSRIPPALLHLDELKNDEIRQKLEAYLEKYYPEFAKIKELKITVDVKPGQMLYLPAGWFHEVTSYGTSDKCEGHSRAHIALNYWYNPPGRMDPSDPYTDDYWKADFERTLASIENYQKEEVD
ncbi:unnamed protein product [[Candida] boidinii]|uniref:Unnamed protein product n=1 Tax=Candida boidinii TaxID=5477 RepID=A0A9W6SVU6_CANBO|nr:hypothetical protein B5S30_g4334 [[Candida] boidinii]OWB86685.1 hypothetical protein B5S33_g5394 [[Candida] boidinii]GME68120.1 unnamed protein product [[Candida] boidinii]GMF98376.1 unnamed protein product [[Candida] boidinii]